MLNPVPYFSKHSIQSYATLPVAVANASKPQLLPFNDHQSHYSGSSFFCYNSAPAAAREVFKPSTDSASLVVSSQKKFSV